MIALACFHSLTLLKVTPRFAHSAGEYGRKLRQYRPTSLFCLPLLQQG
ncbi:hypothetical protein KCP76_09605 [Salmonella enterica subsp. enterica serovar Weltevreden]|nr:hypothetical protein KCP76_09605 [Salmonella enterica subsp. enterica serovar Weltevreden]